MESRSARPLIFQGMLRRRINALLAGGNVKSVRALSIVLSAVIVAAFAIPASAQTPQKRKKQRPAIKKQVKPVPKVNDGRVIFAGAESDTGFAIYLPKTKQIFSASADFNYRWWDMAAKIQRTVPNDADASNASLAPDGKSIAVTTKDGDLQVVRTLDGRVLATIPCHESAAMSTFWHIDGNHPGTITKDGSVRIFNVDTKEITLDIPDTGADYACSVKGGTYIVTANYFGLRFYEVEHNELKGTYEFVPEEKNNTAGPLLPTPDGNQLLVTFGAPDDDPDKNCDAPYMLDIATRTPTIKFPEVTKAVLSCAISADAKLVAFGTSKHAYVFDVATQKRIYTYNTENAVLSVSFSDDAKSLLIGEAGGGLLQVPLFPKPATTATATGTTKTGGGVPK